MKVAAVVLIVIGAIDVLYSGVAVGYGLVAYGILSGCLGLVMMLFGKRLWPRN